MAKKVAVLQHIGCETLGTLADALSSAGVFFDYVKSYRGERVPNAREIDGLVVMGGPMGVYEQDRFPYLGAEMKLIRDCVRKKKPVLGICLGSQLLAAALGADVRRNHRKEIGWHPVHLTPAAAREPLFAGVPGSFMGLHWHGDVFDLPKGAVPLAGSLLTPHQAFRYGPNAYGFLFHMEITGPMIMEWSLNFASELRAEYIRPQDLLSGALRHLAGLSGIGRTVFYRWASLV